MSSPLISAYAKKFLSSLPKQAKETSVDVLIEAIRDNGFVLYGDFHTCKQSQKGFVRIIDEFSKARPKSQMVIALEMFRSMDQHHLDAYQKGEIGEEQFLEFCKYHHTWGFSWRNYRYIIDYAMSRGIKIYGINSAWKQDKSLEKRDRFMASRLMKIHDDHPEHTIFCLVGEYHLADRHLPEKLQKSLALQGEPDRIVRLFTNIDEYYFRKKRRLTIPSTEYLYLKPDHFCIMNTPPWIKWQSYIFWEELIPPESVERETGEDEDDDVVYGDGELDIDFHVLQIKKQLLQFLSLGGRQADAEDFTSYYTSGENLARFLSNSKRHPLAVKKALLERFNIDGYLFLPQNNQIFIRDLSLNNLSSCVGQLVQNSFRKGAGAAFSCHPFFQSVLHHTAAATATKILNPQRKGKDIYFYKDLAKSMSRKRLSGATQKRRDIIRLIIRCHESISKMCARMRPAARASLNPLYKQDVLSHYEISKTIGEVLGYTLCHRALSGSVPADLVARLFAGDFDNRDFVSFYEKVMH
jgi:hypothetical protein